MKLRSQANTLVLSYIWWVLEPLLYVFMFYFVFKYVMYVGGEDYFIFLMVGKIPFLWFSKSVTSGAASLRENIGLISQRVIPKLLFPLVNCQESFYKQIFAFTVLLIVLLSNDYLFPSLWWQFLLIVLIQHTLSIGIACFFAVFVTWARDFLLVIQMFMMGLMFTSGIFWDVENIQDPALRELLLTINPLAGIIHAYRQVLMYGEMVAFDNLLPLLLWSLVTLITGVFCLKRFDGMLTRRLFS